MGDTGDEVLVRQNFNGCAKHCVVGGVAGATGRNDTTDFGVCFGVCEGNIGSIAVTTVVAIFLFVGTIVGVIVWVIVGVIVWAIVGVIFWAIVGVIFGVIVGVDVGVIVGVIVDVVIVVVGKRVIAVTFVCVLDCILVGVVNRLACVFVGICVTVCRVVATVLDFFIGVFD